MERNSGESATRRRVHHITFLGSLLVLCWLGMQAVHELGHVLGAVDLFDQRPHPRRSGRRPLSAVLGMLHALAVVGQVLNADAQHFAGIGIGSSGGRFTQPLTPAFAVQSDSRTVSRLTRADAEGF